MRYSTSKYFRKNYKKNIKQTELIARELNVKGFMNIQFAVKITKYLFWRLTLEEVEQYLLLQNQPVFH